MYGAASVGANKSTGLPMVVGTASYTSGSVNQVSHVIAAPAGEVGDLLVFFSHYAYSTAIAGWTPYAKAVGESDFWDATIQTKTATTTNENVTYSTGSASLLNAFVIRLRNVDRYVAALVQASDLGSGLLTVTAPSGKGWYLYLGLIATNWGTVTTAPAAYTDLVTIPSVTYGPRAISKMHRLNTANSSPDISGIAVDNPWGSRGFHLAFYKN